MQGFHWIREQTVKDEREQEQNDPPMTLGLNEEEKDT